MIAYDKGMRPALKALAIWFAIDVGLPCAYFAITEGRDAATSVLIVLLAIYAISAPFVICTIPLWRIATRLGEKESGENSQH
jgi:hypothetical protein